MKPPLRKSKAKGVLGNDMEDMDSVLSSLTAENCMTEDRRKKLIMNEESYVRDQIANARNLLWEYSLGTMQKKSIQLSLWSRLPI